MCCTRQRLAEDAGRKNYAENRHLRTIAQLCPAISLQLRYISTIVKSVKRQYLIHMFSQYAELRLINGWDLLARLGHPRKFQRVSRLCFVIVATSLTGGQPNLARCFGISCAGILHIHFRCLLPPLTEFCRIQNSLCVQILRSPILAALLHGTRALGVSQTVALSRGRHLYSARRPWHWASAHISGY